MASNARQEQLQNELLKEHETQIQEEMAALRKKTAFYLSVFGEPGKRSEAQEAVWKEMTAICFYDRPMLGACPAGHVDPLVLAQNEGKRNVFLHVQRMNELSLDAAELEKHVRTRFQRNK